MCVEYPVQFYTIWDLVFGSKNDYIKFIQKIALNDTIFNIRQIDFNAIKATNKFFFIEQMEKTEKENNNLKISDIASKIEALFSSTHLINNYKVLPKENVMRKLGYPESFDGKTFSLMSHQGDVNEKFFLPDDYISANFEFKPLITCLRDTVFLNKYITSVNIFEALAGIARSIDHSFDSRFGLLLESFIKEELKKIGFEIYCGLYNFENFNYEADCIFQYKDTTYIIECKKKVLVRSSRAGRAIDILNDLGKSLFHSQLQAVRIELALRKYGEIIIDNNGARSAIKSTGKYVRISLSHLDYGLFHNKIVATSLLDNIIFKNIDIDKNSETNFSQINVYINELSKYINLLLEINPIRNGAYFHNTIFTNLFKFQELILLSKNSDRFAEFVSREMHISQGRLDWHYELADNNLSIPSSRGGW